MNQPPTLPPEAPESLVQPTPPQAPPLSDPITALFQDRILLILLAWIVVSNIALVAYLLLRFDNLPTLLPLHFDSSGVPDRIETKNGIFALPIIGITVFFLNIGLGILLHNRERAATLLLAVGTLFVQILLWIAVINIAGIV